MSLNADAMEYLAAKGLSLAEVIEFARIAERKKDNTAAERQARYRAKKANPSRRNSNAVTPPIDNIHTPRDISSNDESHSQRDDVSAVLNEWRAMAKPLSLPCWDKLTPKRRRAVNARIAEHGFAAIRQAIEHVPKSAFLRGETGNWAGANLDFLTRPDTVPKILEGQYDDREKPRQFSGQTKGGSLVEIGERVRQAYGM